MTLSPGTRLGSYEIVSPLGAGGMGEVYRARDTRLNRDVAIKVLRELVAADAEQLLRFTREAQTLAALNHPNIAAIYGIEESRVQGSGSSVQALVMELVDGEDLSELIGSKTRSARWPRRGAAASGSLQPSAPGVEPRRTQERWAPRAMSIEDALPIARQIADALEAAHELGIVHRDLKPANVKVRADGTVKVLDFGLAKAMDSGTSGRQDPSDSATLTNRATQIGTILGTAAYMAPEQARGRPVDRRADIWAFGVVLYEMLAGRRAFDGGDISTTLANVLKEDVNWSALPADLPTALQRLLRRCLEKDPKRRLSAIGDARLELDDALSGRSEGPSAALAPVAVLVPLWRRALPWAVAAAAVLGAFVIGSMAFHAQSDASVVWTAVPAPVSQFGRGLGPAVAPDGRRIAFVATDDSGRDSLWVRALDAQSAQKIAGTEGASGPFWAPDGARIGFFKDRKLQMIPANGGTPQVLADADNPRGATWNRDGVIVFVPAPGLGLHRVSAASGGAAVPVETSLDQTVNLSSYPSFLTDGQRFLYTSAREGEAWINVGSLAAATSTPVLRAFSRAEYANGSLLFGSKGALYAHAFDPATLALSGERMRLIDFVGLGQGNTQNYSFSSGSDVIAAGTTSFVPMSQLTWFDAGGKRLGVVGEPGQIFGFSMSPDKTQAAVERIDPLVNSVDPWILQLSSGFAAPARTASEGALASSAIWSHDGQKLFYSSGYGVMRSVSKAGGAETTWPIGSHWPQSSSPDGRFVMIYQSNDLKLVPLTGDHTPVPFLQSSFNEGGARFSPDGNFVAYVSDESSRIEVWIHSFPKPGIKFRVSATGGTHPEWSDNGSQLYFLSAGLDGPVAMMVSDIRPGGASTPRRLFDMPPGGPDGLRSQFAVFDDGRRFLININVPSTAPQAITVGQHWAVGLAKGK